MPTVAAGIGSELQPVRVRGDLDLRRNEIRSGRWGQWPAIGVVGFVGFVVLALLLVFGTVDGGVPGSRRGCRLWLRSRSIVLPIALLAALVATESLVTILEIALDRPQPPAGLVADVPLSDDAFPSGHS